VSNPIRFLPIPYDAVEAFDGPELLLVLELYRRAHALRWRAFNVTERALCARFRIGNRRLRSCLEQLEALGLLTVERGDRRRPTRLSIVCPTRENAAANEQQNGSKTTAIEPQNDPGSTEQIDEADRISTAIEPQTRSTADRTLTRVEKEIEKEQTETRGRATGSPAWLSRWFKADGRAVRELAEPREVLEALARVVSAIRPRATTPEQLVESAARPVLRLWHEALVEQEATSLEGLVELVELLSEACRDCPDPVFARDVRGEGWENGRNRSQNVAAVCRLSPPPRSQGATWSERLEIARGWRDRGRPAVELEHPSRASSGGGYLDRLNRIASEAQ
jgi:hypothetical protein